MVAAKAGEPTAKIDTVSKPKTLFYIHDALLFL